MDDIGQRIANLSPEERALLDQHLKKSAATISVAKIPRRKEQTPCSLSFAQQRLWFLDQLRPNSPLYNIPKAMRMKGALNVDALRRALDAIIVVMSHCAPPSPLWTKLQYRSSPRAGR